MSLYSIGEFSKKLNVSPNTLRNWEKEGKLIPIRTPGGRRQYTDDMFYKYIGVKNNATKKRTILYSRVSSSGQKNDLENQKEYLLSFARGRGYVIDELMQDIGSALNYKRKNFMKLCEQIERNEIEKVIITNKDRLVRFGYDFFESFFMRFGCEIVVIDQRKDGAPEQELAEDLVNIVQHFSAKIYGKRTYKSRKVNETISHTIKEDFPKANTYQRENLEFV